MSETGKTFEKVRSTLQPLVAKSWTEGVALANSVPENVAKSLTESVTNSIPGSIARSVTESVAKSLPGNVVKSLTENVAKSLPDSSAVRKPKGLLEDTHSDKYKYEPLSSSTCIRILRVEAATPSDPIHCTMQTVDLNDKPAFLALSYSWKQDKSLASLHAIGHEHIFRNSTWKATQNLRAMMGQRDYLSSGEKETKSMEIFQSLFSDESLKESEMPQTKESGMPKTIFCDGRRITIGENLYNALLHLRKSRPGDYWIDTICIYQEDANEQSGQVQMMGRIYHSASEVVVWLGDVPVLLDEGVQKLSHRLATYSGSPASRFSGEDLGRIDTWIIRLAMVWLLTRRWFRRLWVVQESCLAQKIVFVLGDHYFSPA
ncbi:hypothetical protein HBI14_064490 [Parastagonospora nodorum]|nr:hypothetical protein HBI14_064490 [Parastagonospora nodorum]